MSEPPSLRGTSFQRKEGDTRMPLSPCCHLERKREIFFVCDRSRHGRTADNGKHRTPCDVGSRCFMQTALRRKTERGNEKDPSAALGMTKRGKAASHFFSFRYGSQPPPLRGTSFQRKEGEAVKAIYPFQRKEKKVVKTYLPPSCGRGMPEGQGVGRR